MRRAVDYSIIHKCRLLRETTVPSPLVARLYLSSL